MKLPYSVSASSSPSGHHIAISGTRLTWTYPDGGTSFTVNVTVEDNEGNETTCSFTVSGSEDVPVLSCSADSISLTTGSSVSGGARGSNGTTPYSYEITRGPSWLDINSSGNYTGTPTATGSGTLTVQVTDSSGQSTTCSASWSVTESVDELSCSASNVNVRTSSSVSGSASASGGTESYTYSISSGPSWLGINSSTGRYTGTSQSSAGSGTFTVSVSDGDNTTTCSGSWSVTVAPPSLSCSASNISGSTGSSVSGSASASNGSTPYTYSISSGPSWLGINSSTGAYTGNLPSSAGSGTFRVSVTDSAGASTTCSASWSATTPIPTMSFSCGSATTTPSGSWSATVSVTNGTGPFTLSSSTSGVTVSTTSNARRFTVRGTAGSSTGRESYSISGYDSASPRQNASCSGTVTVQNPRVSCSGASSNVYKGQSASGRVSGSGGSGSFSFSKSGGSARITVSSNGSWSFRSTSIESTYTATVRVRDSNEFSNTATCTISVTVENDIPRLSISGTTSGTPGEGLSGTARASGGSGGWTYSGSNITVNSSTGAWSFTIDSDSDAGDTENATISARSSTGERLSRRITFTTLSDVSISVSNSRSLAGISTGATISLSGSNTSGLTVSISSGSSNVSISGRSLTFRRNSTSQIGNSYSYGLRVRDGSTTILTQSFSYSVVPSFSCDTSTVTVARGGTVTRSISVNGPSNLWGRAINPVTWVFIGGTNFRTITFSPAPFATPGSFTFTFGVSGGGRTAYALSSSGTVTDRLSIPVRFT